MKQKTRLSERCCRLAAVVLLTLTAMLQGQTADAQIRVSGHDMSLLDVIRQIEEVSDYKFFYNDADLALTKSEDIDISGEIGTVLGNLFEGTGIRVLYPRCRHIRRQGYAAHPP